VGQDTIDFTLHIMSELACARLGEKHAVARPQPTRLPFDIRPLRRKTTALSDEAFPYVHIDDASLLRSLAEEFVQIS